MFYFLYWRYLRNFVAALSSLQTKRKPPEGGFLEDSVAEVWIKPRPDAPFDAGCE